MKFLDLFAGIGGFRIGLERAGFECIGFCEIDKFARKTYKSNFNTEGEVEWHDITTVSEESIREIGRVDIITGGFPCQSFSISGKRQGFNDTRGTLFFEVARVVRILKPKYILLENVKNLLSHEGGQTFRTILNTLEELGYMCEWFLFNSKNFGVPQNRERVYVIGHLRGEPRREVFPIKRENPKTTNGSNLLNNDTQRNQPQENQETKIAIPVLTPDRENKRQNGRRFKTNGEPAFTLNTQDRHGVVIQKSRGFNKGGIHNISPTLTSNAWTENNLLLESSEHESPQYEPTTTDEPTITDEPTTTDNPTTEPEIPITNSSISETIIIDDTQGFDGTRYYRNQTPTLRSQRHGLKILDNLTIRKLTPLEFFRLQGFPDSHYYNARKEGVSNSQLYKQAGNAVTINVVEAIARKMKSQEE